MVISYSQLSPIFPVERWSPFPNLGTEMMPSLKDFRSIHEEKVSAFHGSSQESPKKQEKWQKAQ